MYSIQYIKKKFNEFNTLFFNNTLPLSSEIKFIYTDQGDISAGYMMLNDKGVFKDTFKYIISINESLELSESSFLSVLCHEMIHIWQMERINKEKYTSNYSWRNGHDKVFMAKVSTINAMAKEYEVDIEVRAIYDK